MKKMNKKGFTLIEMLVVIAIIAILVAIIIPTVMSSTDKAEASTIAANLRSLKAEISTSILSGEGTWKDVDLDKEGAVTITAGSDQETAVKKALGDAFEKGFTLTVEADGSFTVECDGKTIADWAAEAGGEATE